MKKIILLFMMLAGLTMSAQKRQNLESYTASNGVLYKVGDEIKLARGSDTNGRFVYVNIGGWAFSTNPEQNRLGAGNAGLIVTIKKINKYDYKRYKGVYFTVGGGNITNYTIDIENAIAVCEVENCKEAENISSMPQSNKYEQIKTLKELFDNGALTEDEFNAEKSKILK